MIYLHLIRLGISSHPCLDERVHCALKIHSLAESLNNCPGTRKSPPFLTLHCHLLPSTILTDLYRPLSVILSLVAHRLNRGKQSYLILREHFAYQLLERKLPEIDPSIDPIHASRSTRRGPLSRSIPQIPTRGMHFASNFTAAAIFEDTNDERPRRGSLSRCYSSLTAN